MQQHNTWRKDRDLLAEAVGKVFSEQHDPELEDLARDAMAPDPMEDPTREVEDGEDGVVYIVQSNAEHEDTNTHGIFTDFETAKKHAAEVELVPGFWVGIMEMPLNAPNAEGKYHRL